MMRALTVRQPWASLIALGVKRYETRSRPTRVRGRIAIHAGLAMPSAWGWQMNVGPYQVHRTTDGRVNLFSGRTTGPQQLVIPLGAVIATAELVDCVRTEETGTPTLERALGDWRPGRYAWELADVRPLAEPVPAKGKQGWWDWTQPEGVA